MNGRGPQEFKPTALCSKCKGACCKKCPGAAFPSDFKEPLLDSLVEAFRSGKWCVDQSAGRNQRFVRPALAGGYHPVDPSWEGRCVFLTADGCKLPWEDRPTVCRRLEPARANTSVTVAYSLCRYHGETRESLLDSAAAWRPFRDVIAQALERVKNGA